MKDDTCTLVYCPRCSWDMDISDCAPVMVCPDCRAHDLRYIVAETLDLGKLVLANIRKAAA